MGIRTTQDISDALSSAFGTSGLILTEVQLGPEFFDLRTGIAGELFQKFTNYTQRLAIVVADPARYGDRFRELVHEHRAHGLIRIVASEQEAAAWLGYGD